MKSYNFDGKTIRIDELEYLESMTCNSEFPLYQTDALCLFPNLTEQPTEAFKHISNNNVNYPCIDFFDYLLSEGSYHLLFFNVESKDNCPVLLRLGTLCYMKMWINDRIVYNGAVHGNDSVYILYPLQNGTNRFQVAITLYSDAYIKNALPSFSLLISHANNPADGADSLLFKDYIQEYVCSRIHVLYGINPSDTLQFSILPFDYIRLDENTEINLQIFDDENRLLLERPVDMTRTYSIGLQGLGRAGNSLYYLYFRYLVDNEWFTDKFVVRTGPLNLHKKLEWEFLAHRKITADDDNLLVDNIVGRLQTLNDLFIETRQEKQVEHVDESEYCRLLSETKYLIDMMKSGKKLKDHIVTSRFFSCYFRSQLDRSYELFNVSLPENYNPDTKYPLILCLDYKRYSWVSKIVSRKKNTTFIFADVSCRGYSMGSYVGEAAFWENLNLLTSLLNIDLDRLYLIGISAGAFSALSLACSYPDMFAAITVSCGVAQEKSLRNIEQLPILSIGAVQEMYHNAGFKSLDRHMLGKNPDYHRIVLEDADDNTIFFIKYSQYIYDWLLKHTYRCPDKIALYTEKLLHGKSHWLQISEMDQNSHSACVEAKRLADGSFSIRCSGIHDLKLINDRNIWNPGGDKARYLQSVSIGSRYKGIGLLNVYLDKLRIHCMETGNTIIERIAKNFSQPKTFGYENRLYVDYPLINRKSAPKDLIGSNRIFLCLYSDTLASQFPELFRGLLIQVYENHIVYQGNTYGGSYSILYIIPNPYDDRYDVLVCCANDLQIMKKNFYLRNIIIPSYLNGQGHPYNNCLLLYQQQRYYSLSYWGDKIMPLS